MTTRVLGGRSMDHNAFKSVFFMALIGLAVSAAAFIAGVLLLLYIAARLAFWLL